MVLDDAHLVLEEAGFGRRLGRIKPYLSKEQQEARLKWAQKGRGASTFQAFIWTTSAFSNAPVIAAWPDDVIRAWFEQAKVLEILAFLCARQFFV